MPSENKYLYNGKEIQDELLGTVNLDWYDYGARMYDPALGRFTTQDPLSFLLSDESPYSYAKNNPVKYVDYEGLWPWDSKEEKRRNKLKRNANQRRRQQARHARRTAAIKPRRGGTYNPSIATIAIHGSGVNNKDLALPSLFVSLPPFGLDIEGDAIKPLPFDYSSNRQRSSPLFDDWTGEAGGRKPIINGSIWMGGTTSFGNGYNLAEVKKLLSPLAEYIKYNPDFIVQVVNSTPWLKAQKDSPAFWNAKTGNKSPFSKSQIMGARKSTIWTILIQLGVSPNQVRIINEWGSSFGIDAQPN